MTDGASVFGSVGLTHPVWLSIWIGCFRSANGTQVWGRLTPPAWPPAPTVPPAPAIPPPFPVPPLPPVLLGLPPFPPWAWSDPPLQERVRHAAAIARGSRRHRALEVRWCREGFIKGG